MKIAQCIQCMVQNFSGEIYICLFIKQIFSLYEPKTQHHIHKNSKDNVFSIYGPYTKAFSFPVFGQLLVFSAFLYAAADFRTT